METPLDVLSRAATMLQDSDSSARLRSSKGTRASAVEKGKEEAKMGKSGKVQPSKQRKERRCRDRQAQATGKPTTRKDHVRLGSLPDTPLDMSTRRLDPHSPPASPTSTSTSPPLSPGDSTPPRPSVITWASTLAKGDKQHDDKKDFRPGHRRELFSGTCDPVIDEHFRRSLGKDYMNVFSSCGPSVGSTNVNGNNNNNHQTTVTGLSVDDHFAKALGETWLKLQNKVNDKDGCGDDADVSRPRSPLLRPSLVST